MLVCLSRSGDILPFPMLLDRNKLVTVHQSSPASRGGRKNKQNDDQKQTIKTSLFWPFALSRVLIIHCPAIITIPLYRQVSKRGRNGSSSDAEMAEDDEKKGDPSEELTNWYAFCLTAFRIPSLTFPHFSVFAVCFHSIECLLAVLALVQPMEYDSRKAQRQCS